MQQEEEGLHVTNMQRGEEGLHVTYMRQKTAKSQRTSGSSG
jgi:hypothetical protein